MRGMSPNRLTLKGLLQSKRRFLVEEENMGKKRKSLSRYEGRSNNYRG
jgi:hypothetical protein